MMITTSSDAKNMQDDMGIDTPSPAAASSFTSHLVLSPCQTPISGNRAGDRALASLWIRRLKPRDEPDIINTEEIFLNETKHHLFSKENHINVGGKQQTMCEQGRARLLSSHILSNSGCAEQLNPCQGSMALHTWPKISMTNSRYTSEPAMGLRTSSQALEGRSPVLPGVRAEGCFLASSSRKPPLPPMHGKRGFPLRHPGYKSEGFSSRMNSSATMDNLAMMGPRITPSASKETLLTGNTPRGHLLKEEHHSQDVFDHGIASLKKDEMTLDGKVGVTKSTPAPQVFIPAIDPIRQQLPASHSKVESQDPKLVSIATTSEAQRSKNLNGIEMTKLDGVQVQLAQTSGESVCSLRTERLISKPPVDSCRRLHKTDVIPEASSTASSTPWEMFVETAGPSGSARREFVEVYNRARNELKNQKTSSLVTKVATTESKNCPALTSRGATCAQSTSMVMREGQTSKACSQLKILGKLQHVSQPEVQGQHCGSSLEGGDTQKSYQAYESVHALCGKDSSSMLHGQPGGAFYCYVEPSTAAPKDCSLSLGESSGFRLGFASSRASEQCNKLPVTLSQSKLSEKTDIKMVDNKAPMLLSKRQAGLFDGSLAIVTGKDSVKLRENSLSRSEAWLQRWHPSHSIVRHSQEHKILKLNKKETDSKTGLIEKGMLFQRIMVEAEPEHFKPCSEKELPRAAAMAIVGSTAEQFCSIQPQGKKDSFAFWAGFGNPAPQTLKSFTERGEKRRPSEAEPSSKPRGAVLTSKVARHSEL